MSKLTSKYQISIPRALAERVGVRVGDELEWEQAGAGLRLRPASTPQTRFPITERLRLFDAASARQEERERERRLPFSRKGRGWAREDLYMR